MNRVVEQVMHTHEWSPVQTYRDREPQRNAVWICRYIACFECGQRIYLHDPLVDSHRAVFEALPDSPRLSEQLPVEVRQ
jgi:hypothetical protein